MENITDWYSCNGLEVLSPNQFIHICIADSSFKTSQWEIRFNEIVYKIKRRKSVLLGLIKWSLFITSIPVIVALWFLALASLPDFILNYPFVGLIFAGFIFVSIQLSYGLFILSFQTDIDSVKIKRHGRTI